MIQAATDRQLPYQIMSVVQRSQFHDPAWTIAVDNFDEPCMDAPQILPGGCCISVREEIYNHYIER